MATLVETVEDQPGNLDQLKKDLQEDVNALAAAQGTPENPDNVQQQGEDDDLPEKLRGKSKKEMAEILQNLESAYGRMANDLGTQRQLTDRILNLKRENDLAANGAQRAPLPKVEASDLLDKPAETVSSIVDARLQERDTQDANERARLAAETAQKMFVDTHPDYQTLIGNPEFAKWVQASPVRRRAAQIAAAGDWGTGSDLLTEYKETRKATPPPSTDLDAARKAGLESSGGRSGGDAGGSKKIYRRADILRLRVENPELYEDPAYQAAIIQAYAEKRVK